MKEIKKLLGAKIKDIRKVRGYSQQQLAEMVDIDQRSLSHIECGSSFPTKSLVAIAGALNVEMNELFDFEEFCKTNDELKKYISLTLENFNQKQIRSLYNIVRSME